MSHNGGKEVEPIRAEQAPKDKRESRAGESHTHKH